MLEAGSLGDTLVFTATVKDSSGATRSGVTVAWASLSPGVVMSLGEGRFEAVSNGNAVVEAAVGVFKDSADVTVSQVVSALTIVSPDSTVGLEDSVKLTVSAVDARGSPVASTVSWSVTDTTVARVTEDGWLMGLALGDATLTALAQAVSVSRAVRVNTTFSAVSPGWKFTCAIAATGDLYCWGPELPWGGGRWDYPGLVHRGSFVAAAAGDRSGCVLDDAGSAKCWGENGRLQLGTTSGGSADLVPVDGGQDLEKLSVGPIHACAVRGDGVALCWGQNTSGRLGRGTIGGFLLPDSVVGGHVWRRVVATSMLVTCGVTTSDGVFCWGDNLAGMVGDPAVTDTGVPVPVLPGLAFADVDVGASLACALTVGGDIYCWGGAWGNTPGQVAFPGVATAVAVGGTHACGLAADSLAYCWGFAPWGELGDGNLHTVTVRVPVPVSGGLRFDELAAGNGRTCGQSSGRTYCWGVAPGNGEPAFSAVPVAIRFQ